MSALGSNFAETALSGDSAHAAHPVTCQQPLQGSANAVRAVVACPVRFWRECAVRALPTPSTVSAIDHAKTGDSFSPCKAADDHGSGLAALAGSYYCFGFSAYKSDDTTASMRFSVERRTGLPARIASIVCWLNPVIRIICRRRRKRGPLWRLRGGQVSGLRCELL